MHTLIYFHDAALAHAQYLLKAFAHNSSISQLTVVYPEGRGQDPIFSVSSESDELLYPKAYEMVGVRSSRLRIKWGNFFDLQKVIATQKPDYVIVLDEAYSINAFLIGLAVKVSGLRIPVVCYGFENINQSPPFKWFLRDPLKHFLPFIRKTLRYIFVDKLLQPIRVQLIHGALISYQECAQVIEQTGWKLPMQEQWCGVDVDLFNAHSKVTTQKSTETSSVIAYVGRFVPEKGILDLLNALTLLPEHCILLLIGAGPEEELIKQKTAQLSLSDRVRIFPPMGLDRLARQLQEVDVLALPSHTEVFWKEQYGRVLVEAMAAGIPVVGSRSGAIPYVIGDELRTFEEGDHQGICNAIQVALSMSPDQCQHLQLRARRGSAQQFAQAFINFYQKLLPSVRS
ncbi:glycosyltransferase family 4 protein [Polynucleobacter sp. KF022]|uniref:glycosyltransferase family 4 protein n=1 Tax=Polynucleobacter sp. KF022 TaxID=2982615 RepID=UPI00237754E1|nr:glycosyltransferase family 4 protein [Polynucleobacter sp. KF022]BDT74653.1 glycosyl transferase family 1 [Polynucleobacter sp. KF022]